MLVSLNKQVDELGLQDKLGGWTFHENLKKIFELVINTFKNTSENLTKTFTETSIKHNQALENLNDKLLEIKKIEV